MTRPLAMVTGASSGIGETFVRKLAQRDYDLVLVARRRERLELLARQLPGQAEVLAADLTIDEDLRRVEHRIGAEPRITLLINNAGFGISGRFHQTSVDDHERMHKLHVIATMRLSHAALRMMVPADHGAIVNVSSVAGFTIAPGSVSYSATKHWMNTFTEGLHLDLASRNSAVRVQALCPGFTISEFHDVMPMDRSLLPKSWWCTSDDVVEASLRGLDRGDLFVIPGWRYRMLVGASRIVPGRLMRAASTRFAKRLKR